MKHTIQYAVQSQPDGSVNVRVECTCGIVFAEENTRVRIYRELSSEIMAALWKEAQAPSQAHIADMERGLMLHEGLQAK